MMRILLPVAIGATLLCACDDRRDPGSPAPVRAVVTSDVTWPAASTIDRSRLASLDDAARANVAHSPVPVFVPRSTTLEAATLMVDAEYYALSAKLDGISLVVQGTRLAHRYDGIAPHPGDRRLRRTTGFVTENEGIRSASWVEGGVAYSVDIECAMTTDTRCAGEEFVTSFVDDLVFVGGTGR